MIFAMLHEVATMMRLESCNIAASQAEVEAGLEAVVKTRGVIDLL